VKLLPVLLLAFSLLYAMPTDSEEPVMNWQTFGRYEFGAPCSDLSNQDDWQEVIGKDGVIHKKCREIELKPLRRK
jgi:hypothetical protein